MSFGLSNTLVGFFGYINKILAKKLNIFIIIYLDNIFIYIKDPSQTYINAVWWVLKKTMENGLFINLKNYHFYKDKVYFLGYVVSDQRIQIEDKRIKIVKNWLKSKFAVISTFFSVLPISINVSSRTSAK